MEKEEKTVIEQTVENPTVVNEDVIKNDDEKTQEGESVASTEDETLAPTDDVIPAPVDDNTEVEPDAPLTGDPVVDAPVEDPTLAPTDDVIPAPETDAITVAEPEITNPVVDAPVDAPIDVPVEAPVEVPGSEVVEPEIPVEPEPVVVPETPVVDEPIASDVTPEISTEVPCDATPCDGTCACGDPNCDGTCGVEPTPCAPACDPVTVANIFGTLQDCVTIAWRFHLKTKIYRFHTALNDFYQRALYTVDDIIERYQGICGVVEDTFTNCVVGDGKTEGEYFTELKAFIENNRCVIGGHPEIDSVIDDFLGLIDSTLYKLTSFTESAVKSFEEFVYEDYKANESCKYDRFGDRHSDDPDDEDYDPEFENGECGGESCGEEEE